jgi:DNA ligase-1
MNAARFTLRFLAKNALLDALQVRTPAGRRFKLGTGFSDADRANPPPVGSTVIYTYRDLTSSGLPRFASFVSVR